MKTKNNICNCKSDKIVINMDGSTTCPKCHKNKIAKSARVKRMAEAFAHFKNNRSNQKRKLKEGDE